MRKRSVGRCPKSRSTEEKNMHDTLMTKTLSDRLRGAGAVVVGFADLAPLDDETRQGFPRAVSFAMPLTPSIKACTGRNWRQGMPREQFWDPKACMAGMQQVSMARLGRSGICGMCIAACPFTQAYLRRV